MTGPIIIDHPTTVTRADVGAYVEVTLSKSVYEEGDSIVGIITRSYMSGVMMVYGRSKRGGGAYISRYVLLTDDVMAPSAADEVALKLDGITLEYAIERTGGSMKLFKEHFTG